MRHNSFAYRLLSASCSLNLIGLCLGHETEEISESINAIVGHSVTGTGHVDFKPEWIGNSRFIGPEWWPNPMQNWQNEDGVISGRANANKTLCLLPYELHEKGNILKFNVHVSMNKTKVRKKLIPIFGAGFQLGRTSVMRDYRHTLINANKWVNAMIKLDGRLQISDKLSDDALEMRFGGFVNLTMTVLRTLEYAKIEMKAEKNGKEIFLEHSIQFSEVVGGISLLSHGRNRDDIVYSKFKDFSLVGDMLEYFPERTFGPILWTQYLLSGKKLRLQSQLSVIHGTVPVELWVGDSESSMEKVEEQESDALTYTALFNVRDWDNSKQKKYDVRIIWQGQKFSWGGIIRKEPTDKAKLKVAAFSCDNGYAFPLEPMVNQVKRQDPDMVAFIGDQIYEDYGGYGVSRTQDVELGLLDYFRKYYQFGWTWREVLANRPSVIIPDDHDVFQINLWGNGGVALPDTEIWDYGGYIMPGKWVRAVEKIQTGHLPDPAINMVLPIGIKPYFTNFSYAGVGFAVLEDRKFKSAPLAVSDYDKENGIGEILGKEQEKFVKDWSKDWCDHDIKVAFTQTIFARPVTHMGAGNIKRTHYHIDSGSWPQQPRDRAVRIFGDGNIFTIHGDQHHGILLQQGIKEYNDAGYAFMVPGTANTFCRAWWPGLEDSGFAGPPETYLGRNKDECGNPLDVIAVGNPDFTRIVLPKGSDVYEKAYKKGSGYGLVEFEKATQTALVNLYRFGENDEQFPTFPARVQLNVSRIDYSKDTCLKR